MACNTFSSGVTIEYVKECMSHVTTSMCVCGTSVMGRLGQSMDNRDTAPPVLAAGQSHLRAKDTRNDVEHPCNHAQPMW